MWPSFTVRVLQDTDGWMVATQLLSSIAVIIAAVAAAWFANKKDRSTIKTTARYLLSLLELLDSYLDVLVVSMEIDDWKKVRLYFESVTKESEAIILSIDRNIMKFASCTTYYTLQELQHMLFNYHYLTSKVIFPNDPARWDSEKDDLITAWKALVSPIKKAMEFHKRYLYPFIIRQFLLSRYSAKLKRKQGGRISKFTSIKS